MTKLAVMSVFEHQRLNVKDFTYPADFDWLINQEFAVFTIQRRQGQWQLKVGHYIGVIVLPSGITLEILPKLIDGADPNKLANQNNARHRDDIASTRQWVQQMLSELISTYNKPPHSKHLGQFSSHVSALMSHSVPPLSEWLVEQFLQLVMHYQPVQQYRTQIQNQTLLQGKLLIKEQIRRNCYQEHKFVTEIDSLSPEMLCNRLIKSALYLLEPLSTSSARYRLHKERLGPVWRQITILSPHERLSLARLYQQARQQLAAQPLGLSRLKNTQQLLAWAYWLLQQSALSSGSLVNPPSFRFNANNAAPRLCLLINMNQAFEQWASLKVASKLSEMDSSSKPLFQVNHHWLKDKYGKSHLSIRPDLLIYQSSSYHNISDTTSNVHKRVYSHVIDIKWKSLRDSTISASDAYQLSSYAHAYEAQQVWLVYPVTNENSAPIALQQTLHDQSVNKDLWLVPFNVLSGQLNFALQTNRDVKL